MNAHGGNRVVAREQEKVTLNIVGCEVEVSYPQTIEQVKVTIEDSIVKPIVKTLNSDELSARREQHFASQMHDSLYGDEATILRERARTRRLSQDKASMCKKTVDPATLEFILNDDTYQADERGGIGYDNNNISYYSNQKRNTAKVHPEASTTASGGNTKVESIWTLVYRALTTGSTSVALPSKNEKQRVSLYMYGDKSVQEVANMNAMKVSQDKQRVIAQTVAAYDDNKHSGHDLSNLNNTHTKPSRPWNSTHYDGSGMELSKTKNIGLLPHELTRLSESSDNTLGGSNKYYSSSAYTSSSTKSDGSDDGMELLSSATR